MINRVQSPGKKETIPREMFASSSCLTSKFREDISRYEIVVSFQILSDSLFTNILNIPEYTALAIDSSLSEPYTNKTFIFWYAAP